MKLRVKTAFLQVSSTNPLFNADTSLNPTKQPHMTMETDGAFLICKGPVGLSKRIVTVLIPVPNVKSMELFDEEISEASTIKLATAR